MVQNRIFREEEVQDLLPHMRKNLCMRPHLWKTGQDQKVRTCHKRFVLARNQARYWNQEWSITWEEWLAFTLPYQIGGIKKNSLNVCRKDRTKGWHIDNIDILSRENSYKRGVARTADGKRIKRVCRSKILNMQEKNNAI